MRALLGGRLPPEEMFPAGRAGYDYVYLGYWVKGSPKMDYKSRYRPLEGLTDLGWQTIND